MTNEEKIQEIEEEIRKTPYHKATQHHIGKLKAKLAKLRASDEKRASQKSAGLGYNLKKAGNATVVLCGFPSVGKSTILNALTNAKSQVAEYEFTTLKVIPGMMKYNSAEIQLWDVPGLIKGASSGKGRGKEVIAVVRNADLIIIVVDANKLEQIDILKKELEQSSIRLDKKPPSITIKKQPKGGIFFDKSKTCSLSIEEVRSVLNEFGIHNAVVSIKGRADLEDFIDAVLGNRAYIPSLIIVNKTDTADALPKLSNAVFTSAKNNEGMEELKKKIFKKLGFVRIYLKKHGAPPDTEEPLLVRGNPSIRDVCRKLHKSFVQNFRYARIWGPSAKFDEQKVGIDHMLKDEDILEIYVSE